MSLNTTLETTNDTAKIFLSGELDGSTANSFQEKIEEVTNLALNRLVLIMEDLEYMASAGLRVLIFAKQKMGPNVDIYIVGAQEMVLDTIEKTGFHHSVILLDEYNP
ncbi:anti-sigma factor antagonist [Pleurocapsales cyanobacterium LEGE 10410]|nr:anti-sigma factor antagonist [Pleurocapsales cyanobacterium LEGE 10410]